MLASVCLAEPTPTAWLRITELRARAVAVSKAMPSSAASGNPFPAAKVSRRSVRPTRTVMAAFADQRASLTASAPVRRRASAVSAPIRVYWTLLAA